MFLKLYPIFIPPAQASRVYIYMIYLGVNICVLMMCTKKKGNVVNKGFKLPQDVVTSSIDRLSAGRNSSDTLFPSYSVLLPILSTDLS